jgi:hypothetical protein
VRKRRPVVLTDSQENVEQAGEVRRPEPQDYRLLIERAWADIHHSRLQEWSVLGVVTGAHLGILQLLIFVRDLSVAVPFPVLATLGPMLGIVFAVIGALMTCRHRRLMRIKVGWIYQAEGHLGLVKSEDNPGGIIPANPAMQESPEWGGLMWPRFLSTSWLILCLFLLLAALDLLSIALFALS